MVNIKQILLGIIIGVVLLMFLVFGAKLIYETPQYDKYCNYTQIYEKNDTSLQTQLSQQCSQNYDTASKNYSQKMFVLSLIIGVLIITGSVIFIENHPVSGGFMFGSLMFLIYGTGGYWRYMNDWLRFIILGIALGILVYVSYWIGKREKKIKRKNQK